VEVGLYPTIALSVILSSGVLASRIPQLDTWTQLTTALVRADALLLELDGGRVARGGYVSSDDVGIVIWSDKQQIRVPRSHVVRVIKLTRPVRHGTLIGAAIGGVLAGALFATHDDLTTGGRVLFTSIGIAAGGAIGSRAEHYQKQEIVYVRP
jgi:outer membrane lipoprotein SlyB